MEVIGKYSLKIKPFDAKPDTYEMREIGVEIPESDVDFPEGTGPRSKAVILTFIAAESVYLAAVADGMITMDQMKSHLSVLRRNMRSVVPENLLPLISGQD